MLKKGLFFLTLSVVVSLFACKQEQHNTITYNNSMLLEKNSTTPPKTDKVAHILTAHDDTRTDDYYWMKLSDEQKLAEKPDAATQKVLDYLNAENTYREDRMSHLSDFQSTLFEEIKGRIKQTDTSVPYKLNGYYYITKYEEGKEYPIYTRKKENLNADEELMLDVNILASDYDYYNVAGNSVSPDNKILVYGEDTLSRRQYTLRFKNLETGELYPDEIANTTGGATWANDNKTVFYARKDASLRSFKIFKHKLGADPSTDQEVYHETDETFGTYVYKTKSKKYLIIGSYATLAAEYRILEADNPDGEFRIFQPRERGLEHDIYHFEDKWYIYTNKDKAVNFKVMTTPETKTTKENWVDLIPHRPDVLVESLELFKDHLVVNERVNANRSLRVIPTEGEPHYIDFGEDAFTAYSSINPEFDTNILRIGYTSMTTPNSTYDYNMDTKKLTLLKQQEVLGDFDKDDYQGERVYVTADDGTKVPMSIVYKKGFEKNGTRPVLLYGYGSYGNSIDPYFSSVRLSLLDRGFAFAIAHIRGGQEMGRQWYEDGKYLKKKNTFTDFIDCGEYLVKEGYAAEDKLMAMGGSAGGLLMGAVVNMKPDLWTGVVAAVPFVDVVTTMLDESIPLTTGEYDEWGNPNDPEYYAYMKSYSPYDQVTAQDYPAMLVTTGYHDSQVQYWEPAKWVAKLRDMKTDENPLLMYCNMDTGHGGASGRFERYKETAMEYAFLLDLAGLAEVKTKD